MLDSLKYLIGVIELYPEKNRREVTEITSKLLLGEIDAEQAELRLKTLAKASRE